MSQLSIQTETREKVTVVTTAGRIDSGSAPEFDTALTKVATESTNIVLEMKGVEYMSSAGIRAVVKAAQIVEKKGGAVNMAAAPELITSIFYTVGLVDKIKSYATVEEAIASF